MNRGKMRFLMFYAYHDCSSQTGVATATATGITAASTGTTGMASQLYLTVGAAAATLLLEQPASDT